MLTQQKLREVLSYNEDTGEFIWLKTIRLSQLGKTAGCVRGDGYVLIGVSGRLYFAHRLAWLHVHGRWPMAHIDHISGERGDNRISNLREASQSQNIANSRLSKANKSGYKGVSFDKKKGKYCAKIGNKFLGYFDEPEEAHRAYIAASKKGYGTFARTA